MPTVRNIKYANRRDHNIYIGRAIYGNYGEVYRKGSPLANPFKEIRKGTEKERDAERERVIADYGIWLRDKVKAGDPKVWEALRSITEASVLLCYCYPKNCHGHKIVAMWTWARNKGLIDHVTTPHSSDKTLKTVAKRNLREMDAEDTAEFNKRWPDKPASHTAPGPLDLMSTMDNLAATFGTEIADPLIDKRLDEEILETHKVDCPRCDSLAQTLPPKSPRQGRGAPKKPRARLTYADERDRYYNDLDSAQADLAELAPVIARHEAKDRAFDRAEIRYEREQLALNHAA